MSDWRFLDEWEAAMLKEARERHTAWDAGAARVLRENKRARFEPASAAEVASAERRLKIPFPPEVKEFYRLSNGWLDVDWKDRMLQFVPVDEIEWLRDVAPELISIQQEYPSELSDAQYFDYGPTQTPSYRVEYLTNCLLVSRIEDEEDGLYLLNTAVVDSAGEFEAWFLNHKLPGTNRWPSFRSMMMGRWRSRLGLR